VRSVCCRAPGTIHASELFTCTTVDTWHSIHIRQDPAPPFLTVLHHVSESCGRQHVPSTSQNVSHQSSCTAVVPCHQTSLECSLSSVSPAQQRGYYNDYESDSSSCATEFNTGHFVHDIVVDIPPTEYPRMKIYWNGSFTVIPTKMLICSTTGDNVFNRKHFSNVLSTCAQLDYRPWLWTVGTSPISARFRSKHQISPHYDDLTELSVLVFQDPSDKTGEDILNNVCNSIGTPFQLAFRSSYHLVTKAMTCTEFETHPSMKRPNIIDFINPKVLTLLYPESLHLYVLFIHTCSFSALCVHKPDM